MDRLRARLADGLPLRLLSALLLAGASGFFAWTLPVRLVARIVTRLGLPTLVPATAPPYGHSFRFALAGGGVVAGGVAALILFWLVGRIVAANMADRAGAGDMPVLRRADRHPDAPPRAPISAANELLDPPEEADAHFAGAELLLDTPEWEEVEAEAPPPPTSVAPQEDPAAEREAEPAFRPATDPEPVVGPREGIDALMARIEAGLVRRADAARPRPANEAPPATDADATDALRNALAELQRAVGR